MQLKNLTRQVLLIAILAGLPFSLALISHLNSKRETESNLVASNGPEKLNLPVRIRIPKINVDAAVDQVGVTPLGEMDVPKSPENVAWFDLGTRPGEAGSSVVDGHSGYKNNKPAVFDSLYKLTKGDKIYVQDEKGAITTFVVRESRYYNPQANAKDIFSSDDGKAHLNLITCAGAWNETERSHSKRLVVFADKEVEQ